MGETGVQILAVPFLLSWRISLGVDKGRSHLCENRRGPIFIIFSALGMPDLLFLSEVVVYLTVSLIYGGQSLFHTLVMHILNQ